MNDKLQHVIAGAIIALVASIIWSPFIGVGLAALAGALKEIIWDWRMDKGTPEWLDFVATAAGGFLVFAVVTLTGCHTDKFTMAMCKPGHPDRAYILDSKGGQTNLYIAVPKTSPFYAKCDDWSAS